jgi:preprotein translocase subunit SecE
VARDRQRSKQRRKRAAKPSGGNPARSRARDTGVEDEAALRDTTGAPNPLEHASAEVDEAVAAEAGAFEAEPGDPAAEIFPDELERAPDEVQESEALTPRRVRRGEEDAPARPPREGGNRVIAFLRACIEELRRVQWPDRKHVFQATAVVLGFVLVAGGYLGLMDAIWQPLINAIL